jgi:hypothetical protein
MFLGHIMMLATFGQSYLSLANLVASLVLIAFLISLAVWFLFIGIKVLIKVWKGFNI